MIDPKKQYRTRDGREVRIYAVDAEGIWPVHGAVRTIAGGWDILAWKSNGGALSDGGVHCKDLIEVKPRIKRKVWVNVYPNRMGVPHGNHAYVAMHRGKDAIACVEIDIDVEEGHGL